MWKALDGTNVTFLRWERTENKGQKSQSVTQGREKAEGERIEGKLGVPSCTPLIFPWNKSEEVLPSW